MNNIQHNGIGMDDMVTGAGSVNVSTNNKKKDTSMKTNNKANHGYELINDGKAERAWAYFSALAERDPEGFRGMAHCCANGIGHERDTKLARRYERLALLKQRQMRSATARAERLNRLGSSVVAEDGSLVSVAEVRQLRELAVSARKARLLACDLLKKSKKARRASLEERRRLHDTLPVAMASSDRKGDAKGRLLFIDVANVFGALPQEIAAEALPVIGEWFRANGYRATLFLDMAAKRWAEKGLGATDKDAFQFYCGGRNVSLVPGEADLALLNNAQYASDAVIYSNDRFRDYGKSHPEVVGTDRVKPFSVVIADGMARLSFAGIAGCIVLPLPSGREAA